MAAQVLLLNADYTPLKVINWQRAITLLMDHKVALVEKYADRLVRSPSVNMDFPAVVALKKYVKTKAKLKFSRANVLARDGYQCMYCLTKPRTKQGRPKLTELSIEHIVPRAQARMARHGRRVMPVVTLPWSGEVVPVTCWENVVAACIDCNHTKRDRTPKQAGMTLHKIPTKPSVWEIVIMQFTRMTIPTEWVAYLPEGSPWADYWDGELDAG